MNEIDQEFREACIRYVHDLKGTSGDARTILEDAITDSLNGEFD